MNVEVLKGILLAVFGLETLVFGLIPIFVMKKITGGSSKLSGRASFVLSLTSCFAGGVFFGVCFLDMLPDILESYDDVKTDINLTSDYPFPFLVICLGFFGVFLTEEISVRLCGHSHGDEDTESVDMYVDRRKERTATMFSSSSRHVGMMEEPPLVQNPLMNSLTLVIALLVHVSLEGFAFGVQPTVVSVTSLFFGICVHKALVVFSVGMRLAEAHPDKPWFVVVLITILAVAAPLGGVIGIVIESSNIEATPKDIITCVLLSLSLGTFLYVTFFEILCPEHSNKHNTLAQLASAFVGFAIIAALMAAGG